MSQPPDNPLSLAELQRQATKLKKINAALMSRVERSMDQQFNAFSLFETAIALDHQVRDRTRQLRDALHSIEKANESLYRAKQQAEAASSLKSSVLISVTHDLLQPLNAARLTLSTLAEMISSRNGTALVEQVDRSLLTLEDLLRSLLDIAKLDAGALRPDVRPILIASLFEPLLDEFVPEAAKRGLSLRIVPSALAVVSDAMMLRRILQNLLANALRYTRTGGVVMGCRLRGDRLRIQISDTGPGIPQAQQEAIFLEFQRGESSIGDLAGFGLGLSIVRRFAGVLGHTIQLASRVGHGSTFSVELDWADPGLVRDERHEVQRIDVEYGGLEDAKILLIENDPCSAQAMATLLEKWGCDVVSSVSLGDALARIAALGELPDAIVADLHLDHQESGLTAVQEIRQQLQLEVLTKPVKPAEIRALLSFLLA